MFQTVYLLASQVTTGHISDELKFVSTDDVHLLTIMR